MNNEELHFRKVDGRRLYFPWGIGKAYVLPCRDVENRVKWWMKARRVSLSAISMILIIGALQLHQNFLAAVALILVIDCLVWIAVNRIALNNLEVVFDRSNAERIAKQSRAPKSMPKLLTLLVGSICFIVAGAFMYSHSGFGDQKTVATICITFFGLCALVFCVQISEKLKLL